jgi:hypothetical protein
MPGRRCPFNAMGIVMLTAIVPCCLVQGYPPVTQAKAPSFLCSRRVNAKTAEYQTALSERQTMVGCRSHRCIAERCRGGDHC